MPKFYVQSGSVSYIVSACDTEGAALWVMHRIMDQKIAEFEERQAQAELWGEDYPTLESSTSHFLPDVPQAIPYDAMLDGLAEFDEMITLSERGFGNGDAGNLQTENIFHQWRQFMLAVDRLHEDRS